MKIKDEQSLAGFACAAPTCKQDASTSMQLVKYGFPCCIAVLLLLFQVIPLFWDRPFYFDWVNHVWTIQYYSDYVKQHGSFPTTIDVTQGFGNPLPMFYGLFFYPLLSVFSVATGSADLAVRIFCVALLVAPLVSFVILFRNLSTELSLAFLLAISANASVYQLTNLYARSALTEFVAFQLLLFGISLVFFGLATKSQSGRSAICLGVACATMGLGSHPITFYTFSIFIAPLLILGYFSIKRVALAGQSLWSALWVACAIFVLLPWGFSTIMYRGDLLITATNAFRFFPISIDSLWGRIGLFYLDARVVANGIDAVSTPFLDAPFALELILILVVIFIQLVLLNKRELVTLVVPSLVVISAIIWLVVAPQAAIVSAPDDVFANWETGFVYRVLSPIQFAYRLANTFSACVIVALLCGLSAMGRLSKPTPMLRHWSTIVVAYICAIFSVALVGQKLLVTYVEFVAYPEYRLRTVASSPPSPLGSDRVLLMTRSEYDNVVRNTASYPFTFYGHLDYTTARRYQFVTQEEVKDREIVDLRATEYGREISLSCEQACIVRTNIVPSKFHRVLIDGVDPSYIKLWSNGNLTFPADSGLHYMTFPADSGLHTIKIIRSGQLGQYVTASIWIMLGWFAVSCIVFLFGCGKNCFRLVRKRYC
jgi:hypothetical protein